MSAPTINQSLCTSCGLCVTVCKSMVYALREGVVAISEENAGKCLVCGQCAAACPTGAIAVEGAPVSEYPPAPPASAEALLSLMRRRRSVRSYQPDPVPHDLLEKIVDAARSAPMCFPPTPVECTILSTPEQVALILPVSVKQSRELRKMMGSALGRFVVRRMAGQKAYDLLKDHMMPLLGDWLDTPEAEQEDWCCWGAPALLIFHADRKAPTGETDCLIACTQAMLMAEALGLGAVQLGFAAATIERDQGLRERYGLPARTQVYATLAVGYSAVKFARQVDRDLRSVTWV